MFSNNGKISNHQAVRLLIMDMFAGACLFLTRALPRISGNGGIIALILGLGFTFIQGIIISRCLTRCGNGYISELSTCLIGKLLRWMYGLRCFAAYVFLMGMFSTVLGETFLYHMSKVWIIAAMTFLLIYGAIKGIEVRARLSEIFFYVILIPIVLIGLFSLPEADWRQLMIVENISFYNILKGAAVTWVLMSPVEWMIYIASDNPEGRPLKIFSWAIAIGGGLTLLIYMLCLTVLSCNGMALEKWPTVILMQIIRIPGGFLSRQDGLMLSFWIFAMFISLTGAICHCVNLWGIGVFKAQKWKIALITLSGGALAFYFGMDDQFMDVYFKFMLLSGIVLGVIVPLLIGFQGKKKIFVSIFILGMISVLSGCENYTALEDRAFVMALGVDVEEDGRYQLTYTFPDLQALTGEESKDKKEPVTLTVRNLGEGETVYDHMSEDILDYGQLKMMVLGESLVSNEQKVREIMNEIRNKPEFARTVLICQCLGSAKELLESDENVAGSIGIYMEDMMNHNGKEMIVNEFISGKQSGIEIECLPKVYLRNKKPALE